VGRVLVWAGWLPTGRPSWRRRETRSSLRPRSLDADRQRCLLASLGRAGGVAHGAGSRHVEVLQTSNVQAGAPQTGSARGAACWGLRPAANGPARPSVQIMAQKNLQGAGSPPVEHHQPRKRLRLPPVIGSRNARDCGRETADLTARDVGLLDAGSPVVTCFAQNSRDLAS